MIEREAKRLSGWALLLVALLLPAAAASRRTARAQEPGADGAELAHGRIVLVLPFDNRSGQPSLGWVREAAAELLTSRLNSAGFSPLSREDRLYALDHLGLPEAFQPSRASALKLAQTLDADSIVVGSFKTEGDSIEAEARVVDVPHLKMSAAVTARGPLATMIDVFDRLAWKVTRVMKPEFDGSEETFVAAGKGMRVDAFEQYIRGITEPDQTERLKHLNVAVKLSPGFGPAWMALGREEYSEQQYEEAAEAFAHVERSSPDALEAGFYRGLSLLFSGQYAKAEEAFAGVARILPLAEVLNNQAVAMSRQGHDGSALFRRAVAADPNVADYHFNLAVSLKQHGENADAMKEMAECLKLRPGDSEAESVLKGWKTPAVAQTTKADEEAKVDPLERIVRSFDALAFKQAAVMMDQMETARLAALNPEERAAKLDAQAKTYLNRGLLLEAERMYQSAVAADPQLAPARAGLADVRERAGDKAAARKDAEAALALAPTAEAHEVLGRLDLGEGRLDEADAEAKEALRLDPGSQAAQDLSRQIAAKRAARR
ncbi:MAG TPA: tetratricopeptide repeat protein [Terracidiphilus sp.]|nr:tetratricopeptide repeat protein [Terracidiphilus sp.]